MADMNVVRDSENIQLFVASRLHDFQPANDESHMLPLSPSPPKKMVA